MMSGRHLSGSIRLGSPFTSTALEREPEECVLQKFDAVHAGAAFASDDDPRAYSQARGFWSQPLFERATDSVGVTVGWSCQALSLASTLRLQCKASSSGPTLN
jgi:hypothetical protein